jgi:excisionase family DNA binding protein
MSGMDHRPLLPAQPNPGEGLGAPVGLGAAFKDGTSLDLAIAMLDSLAPALAERVAELLAERLPGTVEQSPWLTVNEAADYLRCTPKRIYDLLSQSRLPRHKDGSRVLLRRAELDAYLAGTSLAPGPDSALQSGSRRDGRMTDPGVKHAA